uniref:Uncharacterized protein n=1 Tax=Anguilla anguilla TaxID=7936 RepID=A0A0E9SWX9_ANGAN
MSSLSQHAVQFQSSQHGMQCSEGSIRQQGTVTLYIKKTAITM